MKNEEKKNGKKQFWNVFAAYYYYPILSKFISDIL